MKKLLTVSLIFFSLVEVELFAQQDIVNMFEKRSLTFNGTKLKYRLFVPVDYDSTQSYPLVLTLHGSGERGNDNETQIVNHRLATSWADPVNQANYPTFVVSPQVPSGGSWVTTPVVGTTMAILDSMAREFNIDENRLYVTGLSMGGFGTWNFISHFPHKFAAAIPMSGGGNPDALPAITHMPIWNFHGESDGVVPANFSRVMMLGLEEAGEVVHYTHCEFGDCEGLTNAEIEALINIGETILYTEYAGGGHVIWAESYDFPLLFPWVFQQYRLTQNAIQFTNPTHFQTYSGEVTVTWNAINPQDSVTIQFSPDAGLSWQFISQPEPNTGSFQWNTADVIDAAFGRLRIALKNQNGFIYGRDRTGFFSIDNAENGSPFVKILSRDFRIPGTSLTSNTFELELLIGDAEQNQFPNQLNVTLFYTEDGGQNFHPFDIYPAFNDSAGQKRTIDLAALPNSNQAVLKVTVDDGNTTFSDQTTVFAKNTPRSSATQAGHISGPSLGKVMINIIDPAQLSGNRYRITFDDSTFAKKVYDVWNIDTGQKVLENVSQAFDGVTEGPLFDGIRLVIQDVDPIQVDNDQTGWTNGTPTVDVTGIFVPSYQIGFTTLVCDRHPADYRLTFFENTVDTSVSIAGIPERPMKFNVWNITENKTSDVVFNDTNDDQTISVGDLVIIVEPDVNGDPQCTWSLTTSGSNTVLPQAGDEFTLTLLKAISAEDNYEFVGSLTGLVDVNAGNPRFFRLAQNYPNPFNPATKITFETPRTTSIKLIIYNLLGQRIRTLINQKITAGDHQIEWDGRNEAGKTVASGVYLYRLSARGFQQTRKMVLMR